MQLLALLVTLFVLPAINPLWQFDPWLVVPWCAVVPLLLIASYGNSVQLAVERVRDLMAHPSFSLKNPNKVRALIGAFGMHNPVAFHRADGAGHALVGDVVRELDPVNPQVAARLVTVFNRWSDYDALRAASMKRQLEAIRDRKGLSPDVEEIVTAALKRDGQ